VASQESPDSIPSLQAQQAALAQAAAEAALAREEFLAIAAHELKTPLTAIKGYAQLLRRGLLQPEPRDTTLTAYALELERQVARFEQMVDDLLQTSNLQQGGLTLQLERVDLAALTSDVVHRVSQTEAGLTRRIAVEAPVPVEGWFDGRRMEQVLLYLTNNALHASAVDGEVRIQVHAAGAEAELTVSDDGIGLSTVDQSQAFRPFFHATTGGLRAGTGLSLYIAAQIVAQHGGTLVLKSAPDDGSTFTVRLPRERRPDANAAGQ
jgi:signal transduction histidine kinase